MEKNATSDVMSDETIAWLLADAVLTPEEVIESVEMAFELIFEEALQRWRCGRRMNLSSSRRRLL
jgi:hypothetical protein